MESHYAVDAKRPRRSNAGDAHGDPEPHYTRHNGMTAAEALNQAEAEGLTLMRSEKESSGFLYVSKNSAQSYDAQVKREGKLVHLGCFATAEEAALCFARTPEGKAAAAAPVPLTAAEVLQQVEAEGLTLMRSRRNNSGFLNVRKYSVQSYRAHVVREGKLVHLGCFATAEEAALCFARTPEGKAAAAAPVLRAEEAEAARRRVMEALRWERMILGALRWDAPR